MELDFSSDVVERLLLRRMLVDKSWTATVQKTFDRRWFKVECMAQLVELAVKYFQKYARPPTAKELGFLAKAYKEKYPTRDFDLAKANQLISEALQGGLDVPEDVLVPNLKEFIRKNAFSYTLLDNASILATAESEKSSEKYQQTINECLESFDRVQKMMFSDTDMGLDYFSKAGMDGHWQFLKNPDAKIHTGWQSVDHYTNGGFLKDGRMLGLFMAQAGLGKSVFLSNLAVNFLKQNLSVVVISLEMSQDVYAQRFDAHISAKNINRLGEFEGEARGRIEAFYRQYPESNLVIKEFPPRSICTRDIQVYLENLKQNGVRVDVIIVDYLNLVLPNKSSDSMFKDGLAVSEELRSLSYLMKCPVISAVQSNSEGMNTENIDMQNVSESRGIVHTADALFAIYQTEEQRSNGKLGFKVIKNRLGGQVGKRSIFRMDPCTLVLTDETFGTDDIAQEDAGSSAITDVLAELEQK